MDADANAAERYKLARFIMRTFGVIPGKIPKTN
jgi:hypothetical protein